jgi:HSP20 family molecular chaperone IbpA
MATSVAVQRTEERPITITPVENLMDRINKTSRAITRRAYEIFEGNSRRFGHDLEDWFKAERGMLHPAHVNIAEAEDSLEVKAEVPGFSDKEIEVSVEPRRLTITGRRKNETRKRFRLCSSRTSQSRTAVH